MFEIHMGIPEMDKFWSELTEKNHNSTATKDEIKLYKKLGKTFALIATNPKYPSLEIHEIAALTKRYGMKVWQSYVENNTPAAGRVFWVYGPNQNDITIVGVEPHPNDSKTNAYSKITLSSMGDSVDNQ